MTRTRKTLWIPLLASGLLLGSAALAKGRGGDRVYGGVNYGPRTIANGQVMASSTGGGDRVYGGVNYGPRTIANGQVASSTGGGDRLQLLKPIWIGTRHARALDGRGPVDRPGVTFRKPNVTMAVTQVADKMFGGDQPYRFLVVRKAMQKLFGRSGLRMSQISRLAGGGKLNVSGARLITDPKVRTIPRTSDKGYAVVGALLNGTAVTPWDSNGRSQRSVRVVLKSSEPSERMIIERLAHDAEAQAVAIGQ
jgi:hypothetical protein